MNFWAPLQLKTEPNEDVTRMMDLQKELQQAWYAFVEQKWGKKVEAIFRRMKAETFVSRLRDFERYRDLSSMSPE
jgi:hypothetical protein